MITQACDWRIELIDVYRHLFCPPATQGYPKCGPGWHDLLGRTCERITAILGPEDRFRFEQVKEERGSIRIYWRGKLSDVTRQRVEEIVNLAEARSVTTCDQCGEEGRLHRAKGVLQTRCSAHSKGHPIPTSPLDYLYLAPMEADGQLAIAWRRYDRRGDAFLDVDPSSLGIVRL